MTVSEAVRTRFSARAFLDRPVSRECVAAILEQAGQAPSGGNLQPWQVYVLGGQVLQQFKELMRRRVAENPSGEGSEYPVYPPALKEPYRSRRFKCGEDLYAAIGIPREDKPARLRQFARNFEFFGAPLGLFFTLERIMGPGQWAHLGMFIQNVMLLAREAGLDSCPQEAWSQWHISVAEFLGLPAEQMLYCGLALGYADPQAPINRWRSERVSLAEMAQFRGFD